MIEYEDDNSQCQCNINHPGVCIIFANVMVVLVLPLYHHQFLGAVWIYMCVWEREREAMKRKKHRQTAVRQPIIQIVCNELIKQHIRWLHFAERSHFQWVHCNFSHLHILFSNLSCIFTHFENDMKLGCLFFPVLWNAREHDVIFSLLGSLIHYSSISHSSFFFTVFSA